MIRLDSGSGNGEPPAGSPFLVTATGQPAAAGAHSSLPYRPGCSARPVRASSWPIARFLLGLVERGADDSERLGRRDAVALELALQGPACLSVYVRRAKVWVSPTKRSPSLCRSSCARVENTRSIILRAPPEGSARWWLRRKVR